MARQWTRRQVLAQAGIAVAAIHTLDPHELCCAPGAEAATHEKDLFELTKVGDGIYAAIAAPETCAMRLVIPWKSWVPS